MPVVRESVTSVANVTFCGALVASCAWMTTLNAIPAVGVGPMYTPNLVGGATAAGPGTMNWPKA